MYPLILIFSYLFLDLLSFTLILPWLPSIMATFSEKDPFLHYLRSLMTSSGVDSGRRDINLIGGITSSLLSMAQFFCSSIAGTLSDKYGRKPVLLTLHVMGIVSYFIWTLSGTSFLVFLLARLLGGASRANVGVLLAMISDISDAKLRTRGMAMIGIAYSAAFMLGPAVSSFLLGNLFTLTGVEKSSTNVQLGAFTATMSIANLICFNYLPETGLSRQNSSHKNEKNTSTSFDLSKVLSLLNPIKLFAFGNISPTQGQYNMKRSGIAFFLNMLLYSGLECSLMFIAQLRFNYTSKDQGRLFIVIGIAMAVMQGGFVKRFKLGREAMVLRLAVYVQILAFLVIGLSTSHFLFYVGVLLYSFTASAFVPAFNGLVSLMAGSEHQGQVLGSVRSINGLARAFGPGIMGIFIWLTSPAIAFSVAGLATAYVAFLVHNISN